MTLLESLVPNITFDPETNPVPEIVTEVPPVAGPDVGDNDAIVGRYTKLNGLGSTAA